MKIWFINHYALPPSLPGGTRHHSLSRELIERGHEVTVFSSNFSYLTHSEIVSLDGQNTRREIVESVPFQWISTPAYKGNTLGRLWNMISFGKSVQRVGLQLVRSGELPKPDVIIGSNPQLFAVQGAEKLARRLGVPFVFEVRDLWPQSLIDLGNMTRAHPMVWVMERMERYLNRKAIKVISLLQGATEHMVMKDADREKIVYLPNGVDMRMVPDPQRPKDSEEFTVMYAGAHGVANGLETIIDAAKILQEKSDGAKIRFRLVGGGPQKPKLIARAQEHGLTNLRFEDPVPKNEVHATLQQADAFLFTLQDSPVFQWGISPNKLFDYFSLARPIVFSLSIPNNPVADNNAGITVPPENPQAMADAILKLSRMTPEERWEMGMRGRRYVEENHDFRRLAEKLEAVLEEVRHESADRMVTTSR
ncbi:MAG: glycosyltransferase family 4 protein [Planctomycetales bacterium]